jgi:superfamily II DNA helicase RecQ
MPSEVVMYCSDADYNTNSFIMSKSSEDQRKIKMKLLNVFHKYINNDRDCRQLLIDHYFTNGNLDSKVLDGEKCGKCDNCRGETKKKTGNSGNMIDVIEEAMLIVGLVGCLPINYGVTKLVGILRGTEKSFSRNGYYDKGSYKTINWWKKLINVLVNEGYLEKGLYSYYTVIGLGDRELLEEELKLYIGSDSKGDSKGRGRNKGDKYKNIRDKVSKLYNVSPYMIMNDKVLSEISEKKPSTLMELYSIDGVSNDFIVKFGEFFVTEKKVSSNTGKKESTVDISWGMYVGGKSINDITNDRGLKSLTIETHIVEGFTKNPDMIDEKRVGITSDMKRRVSTAIFEVGKGRLKPIKSILDTDGGSNVSYFQIKICMLL